MREQVAEFGELNIVSVDTEFQLADLFTKIMPAPRMKYLVDSIRGLHPTPVARRTSEVLADAAVAIASKFDLRQYFSENAKDRPDDHFFKNHFAEPDPILLQAKAGVSDAVRQLQRMADMAPPTHVHRHD